LHEAVVGDGDFVGVQSEVSEYLLCPSKGLFAVNDPFDAREFLDKALKVSGILKVLAVGLESEGVFVEGQFEQVNEFSSEFLGKLTHRDEKVVSRADPSGSRLIKSAAGDHDVEVGMELEVLVPGVEDGRESYERS
jgi:hypothetical protein